MMRARAVVNNVRTPVREVPDLVLGFRIEAQLLPLALVRLQVGWYLARDPTKRPRATRSAAGLTPLPRVAARRVVDSGGGARRDLFGRGANESGRVAPELPSTCSQTDPQPPIGRQALGAVMGTSRTQRERHGDGVQLDRCVSRLTTNPRWTAATSAAVVARKSAGSGRSRGRSQPGTVPARPAP